MEQSSWVVNASFSRNYLVTAYGDKTAKIWGLVAGQWQERATVSHLDGVLDASCIPGGGHFVTASRDYTAKIWGLDNEQCQKKAVIQHSHYGYCASFSPDASHIATTSHGNTAKTWLLKSKVNNDI